MGSRLREREDESPSPQARSLLGRFAAALVHDWRSVARPSQLAPPGDWTIWLVMTGRGWGKTRTGAEWVREQVAKGKRSVAIVGATANDTRAVMIEGPSGILSISPPWDRPLFEPSLRKLSWPSGAQAFIYSADEPERLRGPEHDAAWCDEAAAWRFADAAWSNLMLGLRQGTNPQVVVTTTPKPTKLIRQLVARAGQDVALTRGKTSENAGNLARAFLVEIVTKYEGTRLGRQELDAELLEDVEGSLWQRDNLDATRVPRETLPELRRVVVGLDPSGGGEDEAGIIVCGLGADQRGYVISDLSGRMGSHDWARVAVRAYHVHAADRLVAEGNFGGDMVEATIRTVDPNVSFKKVVASRGKVVRAEPIASLYEQKRVHHVGAHPALEDEMCNFTASFDAKAAGFSPGRVDALVWALTELMGGGKGDGWFNFYMRLNEAKGVINEQTFPELARHAATKPPPSPWSPPKAQPALVRMRSPRADMAFHVRNRLYYSDKDAIIADVDPEHAPLLAVHGCVIEERA